MHTHDGDYRIVGCCVFFNGLDSLYSGQRVLGPGNGGEMLRIRFQECQGRIQQLFIPHCSEYGVRYDSIHDSDSPLLPARYDPTDEVGIGWSGLHRRNVRGLISGRIPN